MAHPSEFAILDRGSKKLMVQLWDGDWAVKSGRERLLASDRVMKSTLGNRLPL